MHLQSDWDQVLTIHARAMDGRDSSKVTLASDVCNCGEGDGCYLLSDHEPKSFIIAG